MALLSDRDKDKDRDQGQPADRFSDPLVDHPVPYHRQRELRVDQLPVRGHEGEEENAEPDEDEPVHDPDQRPSAEPSVPEALGDQAVHPLTRPAAAGRVGLADADDAHEVPDSAPEQRHADEGEDEDQGANHGLNGGQGHSTGLLVSLDENCSHRSASPGRTDAGREPGDTLRAAVPAIAGTVLRIHDLAG
jgi:hypothetical protein